MPKAGAFANEIANKIQTVLEEKEKFLYRQELNKKIVKDAIDIALQGKTIPTGRIHPLTRTINEITKYFKV